MGVKNGLLLALSVVMIVSSVLLAGYTSLMNWSPLAEPETSTIITESGEIIETSSQVIIDEEIKTPEEARDHTVNFLVAGIDYNTIDATAGTARSKLTDVVMVVQIDLDTGTIDCLQFPRDTYIGTSHTDTGKINSIYVYHGIAGLAEVIYDQFALPVDHYVTVDMNGFIKIIDAMGGVTIDIDESFTLEGISFSPGTHTLSGIEAEKFVRERHSRAGGDIGRMNAQRKFLAALFAEMKDLSLGELTSLASVVMDNVTTDLKVGTALSLVQEVLKMNTDNMSFYTMPGQLGMRNGQSIWLVHKDTAADIMNENFREYTDPVPYNELLCDGVTNGYDQFGLTSETVTDLIGEED